jgi:hypothetical protein
MGVRCVVKGGRLLSGCAWYDVVVLSGLGLLPLVLGRKEC